MLRQELWNQRAVADILNHQLRRCRDRLSKPGREIVEHNHRFPEVDQLVHNVTADVASATRHQYRHAEHRALQLSMLPTSPGRQRR
jgi:hypothetical protein